MKLIKKAYTIRTIVRGKDRFGATIATWPYVVKDYMGDTAKHHSPIGLYLKGAEIDDFAAIFPTRSEAMAAVHDVLPCLVNQEVRHYTGWHSEGDFVDAEVQLVEISIDSDVCPVEDSSDKVVYRGKVIEGCYRMVG